MTHQGQGVLQHEVLDGRALLGALRKVRTGEGRPDQGGAYLTLPPFAAAVKEYRWGGALKRGSLKARCSGPTQAHPSNSLSPLNLEGACGATTEAPALSSGPGLTVPSTRKCWRKAPWGQLLTQPTERRVRLPRLILTAALSGHFRRQDTARRCRGPRAPSWGVAMMALCSAWRITPVLPPPKDSMVSAKSMSQAVTGPEMEQCGDSEVK